MMGVYVAIEKAVSASDLLAVATIHHHGIDDQNTTICNTLTNQSIPTASYHHQRQPLAISAMVLARVYIFGIRNLPHKMPVSRLMYVIDCVDCIDT